MIRRDPDHDEDDDDFDNESWDGDDLDVEDDTITCPRCSEPVYEDAERCPSCGQYLSREEGGPRKPWWVVAGVIGCLSMVAWWVVHFF